MELFVSAGEASSDIHCAQLIRHLKSKAGISAFGLGGDKLAEAGVEFLMHNREFAGGGGPLEVISQWPARRRLQKHLERRLARKPPDGAILVDTGEVNLHLAPMLRNAQVPTVYFIPPKVWVWRASRLKIIAQNVDLVLSILPFEEPIYHAAQIPFQYVGNPLLDEVPVALTEREARLRLNIEPDQPVLTMLPGSRPHEIRLQLGVMTDSVRMFLNKMPSSKPRPLVLVPAAPAIEPGPLAEALVSALPDVACKVVKGQSHECMKAGRVALIKSGTSTLEAGLLQVPMVLTYRSSSSSEWMFRHLVRYRGFVGLVNLFLEPGFRSALRLGESRAPVVPEMILDQCRPDLIGEKLLAIYQDGPERTRMLTALAAIPALLSPPPNLGGSPSQAAANAALEVFQRGWKARHP